MALLAVLVCAGCKKPVAEAPPPEPPPEVPAAPPAPASATHVPATPAPRVVEATPAPNYFATPGVFFLIGKASIETDSGITGLPPGTQLQQTGPNEYTTLDGHKLTLRPDQVTNDLRIAQHLAGADAAAQRAVRQMQAPRRSAPPPTTVAATPAPAPPASRPPTAPPTTSLGSGSLGASHSRVKDGYLWQKDSNGTWIRVRPVR
jgi:hypothetical protein